MQLNTTHFTLSGSRSLNNRRTFISILLASRSVGPIIELTSALARLLGLLTFLYSTDHLHRYLSSFARSVHRGVKIDGLNDLAKRSLTKKFDYLICIGCCISSGKKTPR